MSVQYDTRTWTQRSVFMVMAVIYTCTIAFVTKQFLSGFRRVQAKYGHNILFLYFFAICCCYVLRMGYYFSGEDAVRLPTVPYLICCDYPGLLILTICVLFMDYLLRSLSSRFGRDTQAAFSRYECLTQVLMAVFWPVQIAINAYMLYWAQKTGHHAESMAEYWRKVYDGVMLAAFLCLLPLLALVLMIYMKELKRFPLTFYDKRVIILSCVAVTIMLAVVRAVHGVMQTTGVYDTLEEKSFTDDMPYAQSVYAGYEFVCDIVPIVIYTLYLRKDVTHLFIFQQEATAPEEEVSSRSNFASVIEQQFSRMADGVPTRSSEGYPLDSKFTNLN